MATYFITFAVSALLCRMGEYFLKNNSHIMNKRFAVVFFLFAVLAVSALAGARDLSIGTDIWTYGEYSFQAACASDNLIQYMKNYSMLDPLYNIMTFIISRFTDNSHWLYFFIGLIIYSFILLGILTYKDKISVTMAWLCFLFLFYGDTFNAMRQWMSVAVGFWGVKYAQQGKYRKFLLVSVISVLLHDTGILVFVIFAIILLLKKKNTVFVRGCIVISVCAGCFFYNYVLSFLVRFGIVDIKYTRYFSNEFTLASNPLILRLPFILVIFMYKKSFSRRQLVGRCAGFTQSYEADFIILMIILDAILAQLRGTISALYRLTFLFGMYRMIGYSRVYQSVKKNNRYIIGAVLILYLIVVWIYQNVVQMNNEIYPFTSQLLGIT